MSHAKSFSRGHKPPGFLDNDVVLMGMALRVCILWSRSARRMKTARYLELAKTFYERSRGRLSWCCALVWLGLPGDALDKCGNIQEQIAVLSVSDVAKFQCLWRRRLWWQILTGPREREARILAVSRGWRLVVHQCDVSWWLVWRSIGFKDTWADYWLSVLADGKDRRRGHGVCIYTHALGSENCLFKMKIWAWEKVIILCLLQEVGVMFYPENDSC